MREQGQSRFAPPPVTAPGWYPDPDLSAPLTSRRYWDGQQWTGLVTSPTTDDASGDPTRTSPRRAGRSSRRAVAVAVLCIAVIVGGAIFVRGRLDDGPSTRSAAAAEGLDPTKPGHTPTMPNVVAYLDPFLSTGDLSTASDAVYQKLASNHIPFSASTDYHDSTVSLEWSGTQSSQLPVDAFAAVAALQGMPHVLGVERTTPSRAPFCGTVPNETMDPGALAVARALVVLYLGEQDLSYEIGTHSGTVSEADVRAQMLVDKGFLEQLAGAPVQGDARQHLLTAVQLRKAYDATLATAADDLARNDTSGFDRVMDSGEVERARSTRELDVLRDDLGFIRNRCTFLAP